MKDTSENDFLVLPLTKYSPVLAGYLLISPALSIGYKSHSHEFLF